MIQRKLTGDKAESRDAHLSVDSPRLVLPGQNVNLGVAEVKMS
jgi:hypothetical protein